jgi:hypothetical protein
MRATEIIKIAVIAAAATAALAIGAEAANADAGSAPDSSTQTPTHPAVIPSQTAAANNPWD